MTGKRRLSWMLCIILMMAAALPLPSYAYFNRGTVELSTGRSSLSIVSGESAAVSVSINPIKEQQLPGCGMAECPQSCGSTGCLNENGECTCAGTTYQTYYSSVKAESSNASVASAVYENGTLTVRGLSAGSAVITLTGSMRQYTDGVKTIDVTVSRAASSSSSGAASNSSSGTGTSSSKTGTASGNAQGNSSSSSGSMSSSSASGESGVSVTPVETSPGETVTTAPESETTPMDPAENSSSGEMVMEEGSNDLEEEAESRIVSGRKGEYEIVNLSSTTDVRAYLQAGIDNRRTEIFQKKDGDNIEYSWTFDGSKMEEAEDLSLLGELSREAPEEWEEDLEAADGVFFAIPDEKEMPAEAQLYVRVSSVFDDGTEIYAYARDDDGGLRRVDEGLSVENGYVTLSTDRCESLFLTDTARGSQHHPVILMILIAAAIAAAFVTLWISRRKKHS